MVFTPLKGGGFRGPKGTKRRDEFRFLVIWTQRSANGWKVNMCFILISCAYLFVLCRRLAWQHITIQASTSKKSTMTASSCMRAWKLKLDRYGPLLACCNRLLCASGDIDTIFIRRQWASISPAVFVLLQRRLEWMRWSIRWPAHTGMWRNSTWLDQKKSKNFSLWSI